MENKLIKETFLNAFGRFYMDIGVSWSRSKVSNILKIIDDEKGPTQIESESIQKALKELEQEGWIQLVKKDDIYLIVQEPKIHEHR